MGGFLGTAGPLANLLGFGIPAAETAGGIIQNTQNVRQRNANDQAFINMVNQMGPDYGWAQHWLKQAGPGAIPDVAAALGGPKSVGEMMQRQQEMEALKPFLDDPTLSPEQLARKVYEVTGDPTLLQDLWKSEFRVSTKEPPLSVPQMVTAITAGIKTAPENIRGYLQAAVDAGNKDPDGSRGFVQEAYKLLYPALNASYAQQTLGNVPLWRDPNTGLIYYGPASFPKAGTGPGTPRGIYQPPGTPGAPSGGGVSMGVPGAAPTTTPGEGEGPGPGAEATPESGGVMGTLGNALSKLGGAYAGALGAGAEPGAISTPIASPEETPEEVMTPGAAPSEEEATPAGTGLPTRVPTAVPSPTELAMGAPTPTPDTSEPGIPVSVAGAGTPTPLPTGAPSGPFTKVPKTILHPSAAPTRTPAVTYGIPKPDSTTLKSGLTAQRAYISLQGLKKSFAQFTQDEWDRSITRRWLDYHKRKSAGKSTGDPRLDHMIGQLITVEKQTQAAMAASTNMRSYQSMRDAEGHLPRPGDDWAIINSDLDNLMAADGPYISAMKDAGLDIPGGEPTPYVLPPPAGAATPGAGAYGIDRRNGEKLQWRP